MNKKISILLVLGIFLISLVSAIDTIKVNQDNDLKVICINNGYCSNMAICNINIESPNKSLIVAGQNMTNQGSYHNYSFLPLEIGIYTISGYCEDGAVTEKIDFTIESTKTGQSFDQSEATAYFIILGSLIVFLFAAGYGAISLPYKNSSNERGDIIGVNDLKYPKMLLFGLSYGIMVWIANIMIAISNNYIYLGVAMKFFEIMFNLMTALTYPLLIGFIIFMVVQFVKDFNVNKLLSRGLTG